MTPFKEGYEAFKNGNLTNPYNKSTTRHRDWQFGFDRAYFNNLDWVKKKEARHGASKKATNSN